MILRILREMAVESRGAPGLDYDFFRKKVDAEAFTGQQNAPLKLRLVLLESFMDRSHKARQIEKPPEFTQTKAGKRSQKLWLERSAREKAEVESLASAWDFEPGALTIVDLSCPFVGDSAACSLFSICLELFLESRGSVSRIVALDEAHKVASYPSLFSRRGVC